MSKKLISLALLLMLAATVVSAWNVRQFQKRLSEKNILLQQQEQSIGTLHKELEFVEQELKMEATNHEKYKNDLEAAKKGQEQAMNDLATAQKQLFDKEAELTELKAKVINKEVDLQEAQPGAKKSAPLTTPPLENDASKKTLETSKQQAGPANIEGKVLAVNQSYHFVVINLGEHNGIVNGSEIAIKRGTQTIGKAKISSVEPLTAVADIALKSLPSGITIQVGDTILYPGSK